VQVRPRGSACNLAILLGPCVHHSEIQFSLTIQSVGGKTPLLTLSALLCSCSVSYSRSCRRPTPFDIRAA
jgi:CBS-domain-containing membrane protein